MDETENYLNSILQKRIGSVVNTSAFTKNGHTVARLPQQEEKIESMPTVFRKKHQTVYLNSQVSSFLDARTSVVSRKDVNSQEKQPVGSHRVEYMAISKRIEKKKDGEFTSPTVDVTKYRTSNTIVRSKSPIPQCSRPITQIEVPSYKQIKEKSVKPAVQAQGAAKPKRRRIFEGFE